MNAFHIKILAMVTMIIDHVGLYFFPESFLLRSIGRLAFPLFAWLIANGAYHTKNINRYLLRLFIFACISQIPFMLTHSLILSSQQASPIIGPLNIFFTLSIGLGAIILIKRTKRKLLWLLIAFVSSLMASLVNTDYGGFGVLSIVAFYLYFDKKKTLFIAQAWIYLFMSFHFLLEQNTLGLIQCLGLVSLIPIYLYNGKEGPKLQYLFYLIYPLHLLLIYLVLTLL